MCAIVAAAPGTVATRFLMDNKVAFVLCFVASTLLFFVVLLTNFYGLGLGAAIGHVLSEYWQMTFHNLTKMGDVADVRPKRYRWDARWERTPLTDEKPETSPGDDRLGSIAVFSGAVIGGLLGICGAIALFSADGGLELVKWSCVAIMFATVGAMAGAFVSMAILLARDTPAQCRFVVGSGTYGAAFGAVFLGGLAHRSIWIPIGAAIAFTIIGLFTACVGVVVADAKGYSIR